MEIDIKTIITVIGVVVSVTSALAISRHQLKVVAEQVVALTKEVSALEREFRKRLDKNDSDTDLLGQRTDILSSMMSPTERDKMSRELERMAVQIQHLNWKVKEYK